MRRMTPPAPVTPPAFALFALALESAAELLIAALLFFIAPFIFPPIPKNRNIIMCVNSRIVLERQKALRRSMNRRGMLLKIVADDSGIPNSTLASYFPTNKDVVPAMMPLAVLFTLMETDAIPCDMLSTLLPEGYQIIKADEGIDHDTLAEMAQDYLHTKMAAHHPESEDGPAIGPNERNTLDGKASGLRAVGA